MVTRTGGVLAASAALILAALVLTPAEAAAVPPPPPNPSDSQLGEGRKDARARAGQVGELTSRVADAEAKLVALQADVEAKLEDANKALVDLQSAEDKARRAREDAEAAGREADAAGQVVDKARGDLDEFAAGSFKQGSTIGSMSAYLGTTGPEDLLARAQLLNAASSSQLDALAGLERAKVAKANKDSAARAALDLANARQAEAERAQRAADAATAAAQQAQHDQAGLAARLTADKQEAERALTEAQSRVGGLEQQRQRYLEWQAAKQREDAQRATAATAARPAAAASVPAAGRVKIVIDRALSQLGVPYAWGGGNANGPTRGIRDGGVADGFGDYNRVGFDCSGLMIYAFAGVGIALPHYSGYQANAGRRVPVSQMAPGDMLFWSTRGRIHHVALYIGNGQMVEAPHSGARVRIAPVRYGGLVSHATRLL